MDDFAGNENSLLIKLLSPCKTEWFRIHFQSHKKYGIFNFVVLSFRSHTSSYYRPNEKQFEFINIHVHSISYS